MRPTSILKLYEHYPAEMIKAENINIRSENYGFDAKEIQRVSYFVEDFLYKFMIKYHSGEVYYRKRDESIAFNFSNSIMD